MVFFFTANDGTMMYMGKDKFENEDLIKYGWPEDVWFHVDNLSSAHVYIRLDKGLTFETIPEDVVRDCSQLVKANSIEGCKKASVVVIYTPWSNLKKDGSMATGQVRNVLQTHERAWWRAFAAGVRLTSVAAAPGQRVRDHLSGINASASSRRSASTMTAL